MPNSDDFVPYSGRPMRFRPMNRKEFNDRINPDFKGSPEETYASYSKDVNDFIGTSGSSKLNEMLAEHGKSVPETIRGGAQNPGTRDGGSTTSVEGGNSGPLANLKARLGASKINYTDATERLGSGPSAFSVTGINIGKEFFFSSHAGTLYQYDSQRGGNVRPINTLAQWGDRESGRVALTDPAQRLINIFNNDDYRSGKRTAGTLLQQQGADTVNLSTLTQRTQAEKARALAIDMLSDNASDYPRMLESINQGRGNNPFITKSGGSTAYPARERADAVMAMLDERGETRLAIAGAKQGRNAYNSADEVLSRFGEQPQRGFDSFHAANQERPGGAYNLSYTADVFSELPEGQAETRNLFGYRQATFKGAAPAGSTYEDGQVILPSGQALTKGMYFGQGIGDFTKDMGRLGSTSAFARMFGKSLGNVQTGFVNEVNPVLNEQGGWTGDIEMGVGRVTSISSFKSQGVKALLHVTNREMEDDINMRFPEEKRLPAFAIQTLKGEMNQEGFRSWFQETAMGAGKSEEWVNSNISASNQVSLEGMGIVGTNAVGRIADRMSYVTRHNVQLDPTQYDAMRNANFVAQIPEGRALRMGGSAIEGREGFYNIPVLGQEGATQNENGTYTVPNFNTPRLRGTIAGNIQAEFVKDTMRLTPGTLNLMSQYNPEQFDSIMSIGRESQKSNSAYNIVSSYRANNNEAQRGVVEKMFGIADVDSEKVAAIQSNLIANNNNIGAGDLLKSTMRGLQDEYGNQSLRVGGTIFPNARSISSGITVQDGQLIPNALSRAANAVIGVGSDNQDELIRGAMRGVEGKSGDMYGGLEQYTNQSGVLTNALSLQLPRLGGFAIGSSAVGANQSVFDRAYVAKITGISDPERLNAMAASGDLAAVMMRNPVTDPERDFVNQRVTFYDQMDKNFRKNNPNPGANYYTSPTAQASVGGDFDADRGVAWLNRKFLSATNTMLGGALKVLPNSEILQRAKANAAGEYDKQIKEFSDRSGFDALSLKEKYSRVATYDEKGNYLHGLGMAAKDFASAYMAEEGSKAKIGGVYNALERRYGGAANVSSEGIYENNPSAMNAQRSAISSLSGYAQQKLLDLDNVTDTNLNDLIERANNGFRNVKNGVASYSVLDKASGEFNGVATSDSAFYEQNFNKWLDVGSNLSNEEYDRMGIGKSIASQIMRRDAFGADQNTDLIERELMSRRQFGASAENTQNILTLTGASDIQNWGAGDEDGDLSSLSPAAQMTLGPIAARAFRSSTKNKSTGEYDSNIQGKFPVGRQMANAGKVAQDVAANLMNIDKQANGREGSATTTGLTSRMRQWISNILPASDENTPISTTASVSTGMSDVEFSNSIDDDFIPSSGLGSGKGGSGNSSGEGIPFSGGGNRGGGNSGRTFTAPLSGGGGGNGKGVVINFNRTPPSPGTVKALSDFAKGYTNWDEDIEKLWGSNSSNDERGTALFKLTQLQKASNVMKDQSPLDEGDREILDYAIADAKTKGVRSVNPQVSAARQLKTATDNMLPNKMKVSLGKTISFDENGRLVLNESQKNLVALPSRMKANGGFPTQEELNQMHDEATASPVVKSLVSLPNRMKANGGFPTQDELNDIHDQLTSSPVAKSLVSLPTKMSRNGGFPTQDELNKSHDELVNGKPGKAPNELKLATANAAQGFIGKMEDVPDVLMKLADSIAGVGKVSEETVEKAQKYVKAFKDSGDQLEAAIKTHESGGKLTPSQKNLIGLDANGNLDISGATSRLGEQRSTASFMQGSLYKLGMGEGEVGEDEPSKSIGDRVSGAASSAYNRIIRGTGLFHAKLAAGVFINPAIREAQEYQDYQANIGQAAFQTGQVNYQDLLSGTFGTVSRREATTDQARLAYGQQVLSAYSPFVNAALSPQVANSGLGAAAAIGGPALGVGIAAASLFNPAIGGILAAGTAAVGISGYVQSATNPDDIRAKMNLGQVAATNQGNFQGQVGREGNYNQEFNQVMAIRQQAILDGKPLTDEQVQNLMHTAQVTSPMNKNANLYNAVQAYNGNALSPLVNRTPETLSQFYGANAGDIVQGNLDQMVQSMASNFGLTDTEAQAAISPYYYYNKGGKQPTTAQQAGLAQNYQAGNVLLQATQGRLASMGLSPNSDKAFDIMTNTSSWLNKQPNQIVANESMSEANQMITQANLMAQAAGLPQIDSTYAESQYTKLGAIGVTSEAQQLSMTSGLKLSNPQAYGASSFGAINNRITQLRTSGQYGLASQAEQQAMIGGDLYNNITNMGGTANQANSIMGQFDQSGFGTSAQAQFAQNLIRGDRMSLSVLGQRTGQQQFQTLNTQTGMDITYQNIPVAFQQFARQNDPYNQLAGVTQSELASGTRGMSAEIFTLNRNQQALEYGSKVQGRDIGYNLQMGNLEQVTSLFGQAGMGFNQGNGMGYNQLQDAGIALNRDQQRFGYNQDTAQLGIQEANYTMQGNQFNQQFGLQQRKFQYNTDFQRTQMQIDQSHTVEQQGWQTEDLAFGRAQLDIHFGWQQQDFTRNIRYARGREKRDLMREQQRSTVEYAMQAGHQDVEAGRNQTSIQWEQQDFDRRKQYFEQQTQFQKEGMDQQKQFFEQGRELDRQRLDLQQAAHQKQLMWMNESFKLEDQRISLERQNYQYQYNQQVMIDTTSQQTTIHIQNLSNAMNGLGNLIDGLIAKAGTIGGIADAVGANSGASTGSSVGTGVSSSPGSWSGLPAVTGTASHVGTGNLPMQGFALGGYTGIGQRHEPAGVVHKGEYVVPREGSMVVRGQDEATSKKTDDMIELLKASVKVQQAILEKDASFTAIINGKSTSGIPTNIAQQSRAKFQ